MPLPAESQPAAVATRPRSRTRRLAAAAAVLVMLLGGLGFTEAAGVTDVRATVLRLFFAEGTLVVEVDDPGVSISIDGSELVITGAGVKEIRLKPGKYTVGASKDGKVVRRELVNVTSKGRKVVRVSQETTAGTKPVTEAEAWERYVATLPAEKLVKAVVARLKELNPGFDGTVVHTIKDGVVTELQLNTDNVTNIAPVRVLRGLTWLDCRGSFLRKGKLTDLSPLKGMSLSRFVCENTQVASL